MPVAHLLACQEHGERQGAQRLKCNISDLSRAAPALFKKTLVKKKQALDVRDSGVSRTHISGRWKLSACTWKHCYSVVVRSKGLGNTCVQVKPCALQRTHCEMLLCHAKHTHRDRDRDGDRDKDRDGDRHRDTHTHTHAHTHTQHTHTTHTHTQHTHNTHTHTHTTHTHTTHTHTQHTHTHTTHTHTQHTHTHTHTTAHLQNACCKVLGFFVSFPHARLCPVGL